MRNFHDLIKARWAEGKFVCVGLDPDMDRMPEHLKERCRSAELPVHRPDPSTVVEFCESIIAATKDLVCAYKPNSAFFEGLGHSGIEALLEVIGTAHQLAPHVPVILDAKRADIDNTNKGYIKSAFDLLDADAITVHPYLGKQALKPFLDRKEKGIIVLCRTSNKGAGEFQDIRVQTVGSEPGSIVSAMLYEIVAARVAHEWNANGNCALVVGATYPAELARVRQIVGELPILIPGIGAQGGDLEKTVAAGKDSRGRGMIINSSRSILYASSGEDYAEAARRETLKLHKAIKSCLEEVTV
ncbi:MAG: orotidine-5'-phosphate decarboxylase [Patescibacteria group bacterium]|nr:orotidine-5'-phosphate decarboxylase [Patescibacteria group bacterium]